jgi:hypothetical protein
MSTMAVSRDASRAVGKVGLPVIENFSMYV